MPKFPSILTFSCPPFNFPSGEKANFELTKNGGCFLKKSFIPAIFIKCLPLHIKKASDGLSLYIGEPQCTQRKLLAISAEFSADTGGLYQSLALLVISASTSLPSRPYLNLLISLIISEILGFSISLILARSFVKSIEKGGTGSLFTIVFA